MAVNNKPRGCGVVSQVEWHATKPLTAELFCYSFSRIVEYMGNFHVSSALGLLGEELGCRYLKGKGYRIKETNYCNATGRRLGEVDIVAEKDGVLIFVEVKSRLARNGNDILPEAAITRDKLHKLERIAQCYLRERHLEARAYRFDALAILYDGSAKKALIRHLEHIFL